MALTRSPLGAGRGGYHYFNSPRAPRNTRPARYANSLNKLEELSIIIYPVPMDVAAKTLRDLFSRYGDVLKVARDCDNLGCVHLTFRLTPSTSFLPTRIHCGKRLLSIEKLPSPKRPSSVFLDPKYNKSKPKKTSLSAQRIELGVFLSESVFVSEWTNKSNVEFTLDFESLKINLAFKVIKESYNASENKIFDYKMQWEFQHILDSYLERKNSSFVTITFTTKFPPKIWLFNEKIGEEDKMDWSYNRMWERKIDVRILQRDTKYRTIEPTFPDGFETPGKWNVLRVTFNIDQTGRNKFKTMLFRAKTYNLIERLKHERVAVIDNTDPRLNKHVPRWMLDFEVLYLLESNLTHNHLHDYNLSPEVIALLARKPRKVAVSALNALFARRQREFDPLGYLQEHMQDTHFNEQEIPPHCVLMRKAVITPTKMYLLLPTVETSNRIIRQYNDHKDRFLRVQFVDERLTCLHSTERNEALYNRIFHILRKGIQIGKRKYEFLAYSSSQLRDHSCWFFASDSSLTAEYIRNSMGNFDRIKIPAKYAARMGQCFSSTRDIAALPVNDIESIDDIENNFGYTFSDGVGKMSFKLAEQIAAKMKLETVPSAVQFRLGGSKGVLCQSRYLSGDKIALRPSQIKFDSPHCRLEISKCSRFLPAYLNRQAITLLSALGVPDDVFRKMNDEVVDSLDKMLSDDHMAMNVLLQNVDEHGVSRYMADLVKAGFLRHEDPFLLNLMSLFRITVQKALKEKARIYIPHGAFLLGVLDETESLQENEIYVQISDPRSPSGRRVIEETCAVYRNPCLHPGDIRVVTAVNCPQLNHLVDVVVFSSLGHRDLPSQCSGGDLDGDDYTIIWDERLIPKKRNELAMEYIGLKKEPVENVTIESIVKFFVNYILQDKLGQISNAHMARADMSNAGAFDGGCKRLAQLQSDAVDFPKTGMPAEFPSELRINRWPDFMGKPLEKSYPSNRILGQLYRSITVSEFDPKTDIRLDQRIFAEGYGAYLKEARKLKRRYDDSIQGLMNQYGIASEYEVVSGFLVNPSTNNEIKKPRDLAQSIMVVVTAIRNQYRAEFEKEFYVPNTRKISPNATKAMEAKACAWYYVTYHERQDLDKIMLSFPWCIHETLCGIAKKKSQPNTRNVVSTAGGHEERNHDRLPENNDHDDDDDGMNQFRQSIGL